MSHSIILEGEVSADGKLVIQLPPDGPRGTVEVTVRAIEQTPARELSPEEEAALDAEFEALMSDPTTFTGLGLTAEEIARSPEIGIWADRDDIKDSVEFVARMRRENRERKLGHE